MTRFDLRLQDCVTGMASVPDQHLDLVVTSPPYNLGIRYRKFSDRQDRRLYLNWCAEWATLRNFFVLQNSIHWIKSIAIDTAQGRTSAPNPHLNPLSAPPSRDPNPDAKRQVRVNGGTKTYGHFKPISSKRFLNDCHEYIFHFTQTGRVELDRLALGVPYQDKSNIARWRHTRGSDVRCRGNTWFIPYETIQSREKERPHPATFPVQLAEWCIKLHGLSRVQTMLDPFLGIGNSAVAAQRCGVKKFVGFEIDENYLAEAKRRLNLQKL